MKKYFDAKITLADCKPRLIHGFCDYLREDGDSEQTEINEREILVYAFRLGMRIAIEVFTEPERQ